MRELRPRDVAPDVGWELSSRIAFAPRDGAREHFGWPKSGAGASSPCLTRDGLIQRGSNSLELTHSGAQVGRFGGVPVLGRFRPVSGAMVILGAKLVDAWAKSGPIRPLFGLDLVDFGRSWQLWSGFVELRAKLVNEGDFGPFRSNLSRLVPSTSRTDTCTGQISAD